MISNQSSTTRSSSPLSYHYANLKCAQIFMDLNLQFCFVVILDKLKGTVAFPCASGVNNINFYTATSL